MTQFTATKILVLVVLTAGASTAGAQAPPAPEPPPAPAPQPPPAAPERRQPPLALPPLIGPGSGGSFFESPETKVGSLDVILGQGRLVRLTENLAAEGAGAPVIAVGNPGIVDVVILGPRQLRLVGLRMGMTDLAVTTADGRNYSMEVRVVADLNDLKAQIHKGFPSSHVKLTQALDRIILEGEARDTLQSTQILATVAGYLSSIELARPSGSGAQGVPLVLGQGNAAGGNAPGQVGGAVPPGGGGAAAGGGGIGGALAGGGGGVGGAGNTNLSNNNAIFAARIINLLRVPGPQQVLLKVRIAEMNRTAMRQIGGNILGIDPRTGAILGTQIGGTSSAIGNLISPSGANGSTAFPRSTGLAGGASLPTQSTTTLFGIFQKGNVEALLYALRKNSILKILAEPNLLSLSGQQASFLAGGEFPVPVPQVSASGVAPTITVNFKKFGVQLDFLPFVLDDEVIRLTVDPVVSAIDFSVATTLVAGGTPVPGLNTRQAHTTVELRPGQTLAIAGLLQLTLDGTTARIPGLGDLPVIGPFFSNTTGSRIEKELVVLVTPYLVEPMNPGQVPPGPGDEVDEPGDLEFYFLNRIEGRVGVDRRSTVVYPDPLFLSRYFKQEKVHVKGPVGFSD